MPAERSGNTERRPLAGWAAGSLPAAPSRGRLSAPHILLGVTLPKNYKLVSPKEFLSTARRSRGYLPHWDSDESVLFLTYRLADSLPRGVAARLQEERETMLRSITGGMRDPTRVERSQVSRDISQRLEGYLDRGLGSCFLRNPLVAQLIVDNLRHFDPERCELFAFCVMPNHVHVVMGKSIGWHLDKILHSWKSYTSKKAREIIGRQPFFWQATTSITPFAMNRSSGTRSSTSFGILRQLV